MIIVHDYGHRITPVSEVQRLPEILYGRKASLRPQSLKQFYQNCAALTNDWHYYQKLLELEDNQRKEQKTQTDKSDGKTTSVKSKFAEALEQELKMRGKQCM